MFANRIARPKPMRVGCRMPLYANIAHKARKFARTKWPKYQVITGAVM